MTGYEPIVVRDLEPADRDRLRDWRNRPQVREFSAAETEVTADEHAAWFERTLANRAGQVLVVEVGGRAVGVVQLEGVDEVQQTASWGCHLGEVDVPPGFGAVLPLIGLGLGFDRWDLRRMHAQVLGHNRNMLGIHRRMKIPAEGILRQHLKRADGSIVDVHQFGVLRDEWPTLRETAPALLPKGLRVELASVLSSLESS